jgi:cystathionine gamma-synthase
MVSTQRKLAASSWLVSAGRPTAPGSPLNAPLVPASNFLLGGERAYARDDGTPTWEALEDVVGRLEQGLAVSFSSGMAAIAAVFDRLSSGAVVVIPSDCYQGVVGLAMEGQRKKRWSVERLAVEDTERWVRASAHADLVWLETPSNPLLVVADLAAICATTRKPGAIVAVDNTFATPLNQRPLDLGADISVQSATKLIGGHSDLLAGVATTRDASLHDALRRARELAGATPGTLEAYLAVRGARTMAIRLERAEASAMSIAQRLEAHARVTKTRYPGLASHPTHETAKRQLRGFGTIISFDVAGDATAADRVCSSVALIRHATSLGGVESTIERRASIPGQEQLPASLLRLSVGIEDPEDLWADLVEALGAP